MSYQRLSDETCPASLVKEFDEFEDQFLISPQQPLQPKTIQSTTKSSVSTSHSSSGNYSLSTENGESSAGNCVNTRYRSITSKRMSNYKDKRRSGFKDDNKITKSLENLSSRSVTQKPHVSWKTPKYAHVKSKVKQYIDEARSKHTRHVLKRHNSAPETSSTRDNQELDEISEETNVAVLQTMLREKIKENEALFRQFHFIDIQREEQVVKIETLKRKIDAMRLEETKREQQREKERQAEREYQEKTILAAYLQCNNHAMLNKNFTSVGTQTSPMFQLPFDVSTFINDDSLEISRRVEHSTEEVDEASSTRVRRELRFTRLDSDQPLASTSKNQLDINANSVDYVEDSPSYIQVQPPVNVQMEGKSSPSTELEQKMCFKCAKNKAPKRKRSRLASLFCLRKIE